MKFTISREQFLQPLQLVSGAVERRHTLPILSNVLIKVSEDALWLTGTDLEVELISSVKLEGEFTEGEITVPAKKLFDIIRGIQYSQDMNEYGNIKELSNFGFKSTLTKNELRQSYQNFSKKYVL